MQDDLIIRLKQLQIVHQGPVELKNAGSSQYYIDIKKAYGDAEAFDLLVRHLGEKIPNRTTCIAASGYGGIPLAAALAVNYLRNLVLVREEPKSHGLMKMIEGYTPTNEDRITIVDDVFTTGGNLRKIIALLQPTGAEMIGCYVVVKRGQGDLPVPLEYLLEVKDLL